VISFLWFHQSVIIVYSDLDCFLPSVLLHLLGKSILPVKNDWCGAGVVICLEQGANDLRMFHLMPLPPHHLLH